MSACWEQQMVSLVEYTRDERRKLLDACREYRSKLDEANRRIDELRDQLTCTQNARDDAARENANLFARQTVLVSEVESLRKQRNEAETEAARAQNALHEAKRELGSKSAEVGFLRSYLDMVERDLAEREKQPTPVWQKYGHPSEVLPPNGGDVGRAGNESSTTQKP